MKKKNNTAIIVLIILAIAVIGAIGISFNVVDEAIWVPTYWTAECVELSDKVEVSLGKVDNAGEFYSCSTSGGNGQWIPEAPNIQCEYEIETSGFSYSVYDCPPETIKDQVSANCRKLEGQIESGFDSYAINSGRTIFVNPTSFLGLGSANIRAQFPNYGLRVRQSRGFVERSTNNCLVNSLPNDIHEIDLGTAIEVKPNFPFNAVSGLSLARTPQVVELSDVEGGDTIYITRAGYYNKIKTADDGFRFVDTTREYSDSDIQCIPRTAGCSDEAKITIVDDTSCDVLGGSIVDYAPVQGDSSQLCKYDCAGGKLLVTNDCVQIPTECPADKPLYDASKALCVSASDYVEKGGETSNTLLYVILGVLVAIIALVIIKREVTKK